MDILSLPGRKEENVNVTCLTLPTQPRWCRNVVAEVDGRDRYHPRFLFASSDSIVRVTASAESQV
jgi:hypothetical protein